MRFLSSTALLLVSGSALAQISGTWVGGSGNWSDPTHWTSNPNVPNSGGLAHLESASGSPVDVTIDTAVSLGTLSFDGPIHYRLIGPLTLVAPAVVYVGGDPERSVNLADTTLSGSAGFAKTGPGVLSLAPASALTGATTILGGTLIAQTSALPAGSITLDGGTFSGRGVAGTFTTSQTIHVGSSGGTFASSFRAVLNGPISGSGTFTVDNLGVGSGSTARFTAASPFAGHLLVREGATTLSGNASMLAVSGLTIQDSLYLDNSTTSTDRFDDVVAVAMDGGELRVIGGATERIGVLTAAGGYSSISRLDVSTLTRQGRATLGASAVSITGDVPTLIGGGAPGTPAVGVLPFVTSDVGLSAVPTTVDAGIVRPLGYSEFVYGLGFGSDNQNVWIGSTQESTTSKTINSLSADGADLSGNGTLLVSSGVLCLNGTPTISAPLNFGSAEGIVYASLAGEPRISGVISGNNGLTIARGRVILAGANTYSGQTTINGVLKLEQDVLPPIPGPLGISSSPVAIRGSIQFAGAASLVFARDMVLRSPTNAAAGLATVGPSVVISGNLDVEGPFSLSGALASAALDSLVVTGNITGDGRLMYPTNLTLAGNNSFTGGIYLAGGPLGIGSDTALGTGTLRLVGLSNGTISSVGGPRTVANPIRMERDAQIGGSFPLTLSGTVDLNNGTRTILTTNTALTTLSGNVINGWLNKAGPGTLAMRNVRLDWLGISTGVLQIMPNGTAAGASRVGALSIAGGANPAAILDINDNAFTIDYTGASPLAVIRSQVASAYAAGSWTGNGITSSQANASQFGVGYAEASTLPSIPAIFGTVDADAVLIRFTRYGDANLDGIVNLADFNRLAANFGTGDEWNEGDFNYDALVNLQDFNRLAANFGLTASADGPTPQDWATLASVVPEAGPIAVRGAFCGILLLTPRRKNIRQARH